MNDLFQALNKQLANWSVMYIKLHHYHWYVSGPQFFTLHAKFQELYEEATLHADEIAERILALGGAPLATMKEYLSTASVTEAGGGETAEQMTEAVANDFATLTGELKQAMAIAQELGDETTSDMLLAIHTGLEKHIWMLRSFLGRGAR